MMASYGRTSPSSSSTNSVRAGCSWWASSTSNWRRAAAVRLPCLSDSNSSSFVNTPNRYGLGVFYELHVSAWRNTPNGTIADWNPTVSCDEYTGEAGATHDHSSVPSRQRLTGADPVTLFPHRPASLAPMSLTTRRRDGQGRATSLARCSSSRRESMSWTGFRTTSTHASSPICPGTGVATSSAAVTTPADGASSLESPGPSPPSRATTRRCRSTSSAGDSPASSASTRRARRTPATRQSAAPPDTGRAEPPRVLWRRRWNVIVPVGVLAAGDGGRPCAGRPQ